MKTQIRLISLLLLFAVSAMAAPVGRNAALQQAKQFLQSRGITSTVAEKSIKKSSGTNSQAAYYIFDAGQEQGFVIIAGDDRVAPVLGYTEKGHFDEENMPDNMRAWLEGYAEQMSTLSESDSATEYATAEDSKGIKKVTGTKAAIDPIVRVNWNQNAPYNNQCPSECVTGCVATAMAQIMSVWQYPSSSLPAMDAYTDGNSVSVDAITSHDISWPLSDDNIAWLMRHCGQSVNMTYGASSSGGSSASSSDVPEALIYFGYDKWVREVYREQYLIDEWEDLMYNELNEGRAVFYSAKSRTGGHAFICDGYDGKGFFHINWGWGGMSDGYFLLSILEPESQGIGGGTGGYSQSQSAIIGISHGQYNDSELSSDIHLISNSSSLTDNTLTYSLWNYCGHEASFYTAMGRVKDDGTIVTLNNTVRTCNLKKSYGYSSKSYTPQASQFPGDGTYKVVPCSKLNTSSVYYSAWASNKFLYVTISGGEVTSCSMAPVVNISATPAGIDGTKIVGFNHTVKFNVQNNGPDEYSGNVYFLFKAPDGTVYKISKSETSIYLRNGESVNATYSTILNYGEGEYTFYLSKVVNNISSSNLLAQQTVQINAAPETKSNLTISSNDVKFVGGKGLKLSATITNNNTEAYPYPLRVIVFRGDISSSTASSFCTIEHILDTPIASGETRTVEIPIDAFSQDGLYISQIYYYYSKSSLSAATKSYSRFLAVPIGSTGYATYATTHNMDIASCPGLTAYVGKLNTEKDNLVLTAISKYKGGTGIVVQGDPNSIYAVPRITTSVTATANDLVGVTTDGTAVPSGSYVLGKNSSDEIGFFRYAGTTMNAGHAYLPGNAVAAASQINVIFDDEATSVNSEQRTVNNEAGAVYNLSGQKVASGYKGLVIKNGKKVLVK